MSVCAWSRGSYAEGLGISVMCGASKVSGGTGSTGRGELRVCPPIPYDVRESFEKWLSSGNIKAPVYLIEAFMNGWMMARESLLEADRGTSQQSDDFEMKEAGRNDQGKE